MNPLLITDSGDDRRRLLTAVTLAAAVHAALIMGVRIVNPDGPPKSPVLSINVTLLESPGGQPQDAAPTPPPAQQPRPLPMAPPARPAPVPPTAPDVVATTRPRPAPAPRPAPIESPAPVESPAQPAPPPPPPPQAVTPPSAVDLMSSGLRMARQGTLDSDPEPVAQADSAREKYLDPKSATTLEGFYRETWMRKVEQVGSLNFPEEAVRQGLTGSLTLDVALRPDGGIHAIRLVRSSGHKVLDDAAFNIVRLAAPFAPFPDELRAKHDILHIVCTWQFLHGKRLHGD